MSKLETNQVDPATGTTLTLGTSGDTITIPSGVTIANSGTATGFGANTPAFFVYLGSDQTGITAGSYTKVLFDSEDVDTNSAFASNKFTVPSGEGGKYFVALEIQMNADGGAGHAQVGSARIYKNGSVFINGGIVDYRSNNGQKLHANVSAILDLSASDYLEGYGELHTSSGNITFKSSNRSTRFFGYKLIGV